MKNKLFALFLAACSFASAQVNWQEASPAQVAAGTVGAPYAITPRRLAAGGGSETFTTVTATTSVTSPIFKSNNADPADAGVLRLGNAESIAWENNPTGTDITLTVNSSNQFAFSASIASPTFVTPTLGAALATSVNGIILTSGTGTLTITGTKTVTFNSTSTFTGTDAQTYTFPTTTATLARIDAANTFTGASTTTSWAENTPVITGGLTASGSGANTFVGSTGTFITSTGANTLSGATTINDATTPSLTTAAGKTNTGFLTVSGKTSGTLKITTADATAQAVTVSAAAQTVGATTLTIPDFANVSDTFAFNTLAGTLANKTLTAPIINGATSASGNFNLSGSSGTFLTSTGAVTIGPGAVGMTGATTITGPAATTALTIVNTARTSGVLPYIKYTIPTDTAQTAATESPGIQGVTGTRTWATTGTVALQREIFFPGPTYASAGASQTFTEAFNMYLTPPVVGSNAIFTRGHTLGIVDSTSASSSITGGVVVATTLGTTATSVGIGGGNVNAGGTLTAGGSILSSSASGGIGFATGAGGTVTQATNKGTGVTLNAICGKITMNNASFLTLSQVGFTLTNSSIGANDTVVVQVTGGSTVPVIPFVYSISSGSCIIGLYNVGSTASDAIVLTFAVIKAVTS